MEVGSLGARGLGQSAQPGDIAFQGRPRSPGLAPAQHLGGDPIEDGRFRRSRPDERMGPGQRDLGILGASHLAQRASEENGGVGLVRIEPKRLLVHGDGVLGLLAQEVELGEEGEHLGIVRRLAGALESMLEPLPPDCPASFRSSPDPRAPARFSERSPLHA